MPTTDHDRPQRAGLRVLLIDDNPDDRALVLREVQREFAEVQVEQVSGPEPLARVLDLADVQVVITDYQLRFSDGLAVLRAVKARWPDVPVIMFTATGSEEIAVEAMKAGLDDYILKSPKHLARLRASVRGSVEQQRQRAAARAVEARYHQLFAGVPVGLWRATPAGQILEANPALVSMLAYPSEAALKAATLEALYLRASDYARWRATLAREGIAREYESELRRFDGTPLWVISSTRVVRDDTGQTLYYEGTLQDVTERRRAEAELRVRARQQAAVAELGQRALAAAQLDEVMADTVGLIAKTLEVEYGKIFERAPAGDALVLRAGFGVDGRVGRITVSAGWDSLAGYTLRSPDPVLVEDFRSEHRFTQPLVLRELGVVSGISVAVPGGGRPFGVLGAFSTRRQRFTDDDMHFLQAVANVLAAAIHRAHAENAIRRSEASFRLLFESTPHPMWLYAADTLRVVEVNGAAVATYGYSRDEFLTMRMTDLEPPEEGEERVRLPDPHDGHEVSGARRHATKGGRRLDVEVTQRLLDLAGRRCGLVLAQDVTERKRAEETLRQSEKLAALAFLLAGVAHELNNPLSIVIAEASCLAETLEGETARGSLARLSRAATRCARIVTDFLALARAEPAHRQPVALNEIVADAVEVLSDQLRLSAVDVTLDLSPELPVLSADPHALHQLVVNLIANAHQAMRTAPPPRRLTVQSRRDPRAPRVVLDIADTGPGIPAALLPRIFEPFFTTKPPGQGSGLGLVLCQRIAEGHGGAIRVDSSPGRGATFTVELPVETLEPSDAPAAPTSLPPRISGKRVLVAEDEPDLASILTRILEAEGHRVETTANGLDALIRLESQDFDLILSDIKMPALDGPGLYRAVAERRPDLVSRFVFLTGDTLSPDTADFLTRTTAARLAKPFTSHDVRRVTRAALHLLA